LGVALAGRADMALSRGRRGSHDARIYCAALNA
jgi:hypothetical protein